MMNILLLLVTVHMVKTKDDGGDVIALSAITADGGIIGPICAGLALIDRKQNIPLESRMTVSPLIITRNDTCLLHDLPRNLSNKAVLLQSNPSCHLRRQIKEIEDLGASLLILYDNTVLHSEDLRETRASLPVNITVVSIRQKDADRLRNMTNVSVGVYAFHAWKYFESSQLIMLIYAITLLVLGSIWGGEKFIRNSRKAIHAVAVDGALDTSFNHPRVRKRIRVFGLHCIATFLMSLFMASFLLFAYYFPKVMTYIIIFFFCLSGSFSITLCLSYILNYFKCCSKTIRIFGNDCHLSYFITFPFAAGIVLIWFNLRDNRIAWIFQNIIGAAICLEFMSMYRISNLTEVNKKVKNYVLLLLLMAFFLYDAFFVYITPHLGIFQKTPIISAGEQIIHETSCSFRNMLSSKSRRTGISVMEYVALGVGSDDVNPLLFFVPSFYRRALCDNCPSSVLLGYGDVFVPGILATFCRVIDLFSKHRVKVYHTLSIAGYTIGLTIAMMLASSMKAAQPALFYIVPIMLIPILLTALIRKDLVPLMNGNYFNDIYPLNLDVQANDSLKSERDELNLEERTNDA